ncbi:MAG: PqqD family protein [Anaerolineales bacterium]
MGENGRIKPKARTDMAEEWLGQEVFVYDPSNGDEVLRLNSGAALIWLMCDGSRDLSAIADELASEFELSETELLGDVEQAVEQFEELELVEL